MRLILVALAVLLCAAPVRAQQSSGAYLVEVLVFRNSAVGASEDWDAPPSGRGFGNENTRGGTPQVLRVLPSSDYRLASVETTLRNGGAWRPLAHAAWVQTAAAWGTHIGIALSDIGISVPGLSGSIYLERATYLHLGVDLRLSGGGPTYAIDEMRSIKFNERQYFDHPAFGVIAIVSPVQAGAAAASR